MYNISVPFHNKNKATFYDQYLRNSAPLWDKPLPRRFSARPWTLPCSLDLDDVWGFICCESVSGGFISSASVSTVMLAVEKARPFCRAARVITMWRIITVKISTSSQLFTYTVIQLGIFLRALRPARTGLRPARFTSTLPELQKKKKITNKNYNFFFPHLQNVIAVVFSDSRCKNACACRFVPMFSSIAL